MTIYWFQFDFDEGELSPIARYGCGVTAFDLDDAVQILQKTVFADENMPVIKEVIEGVDVSTLDEGHVLPNMGIVIDRGVWFPIGYEIIE